MIGRAARLGLCAWLGVSACAPTPLELTRPGQPRAPVGTESAEELRDRFTRTRVPEGLEIRWIEVTLLDPAWVAAEDQEAARLARAPAGWAEARTARRLRELGYAQGLTFEVWLFTHCRDCSSLAHWQWILTGPGPDDPARPPTRLESQTLEEVAQTLTLHEVSRVVQLRKVRGWLHFSGAPGAGVLKLEGRPVQEFDPLRFEWLVQ